MIRDRLRDLPPVALAIASAVPWLLVWGLGQEQNPPPMAVLVVAFVVAATAVFGGVVSLLVGSTAMPFGDAWRGAAVSSGLCAVVALASGPLDPLLIGATWTALTVLSFAAFARPSGEGRLALRVVVLIWLACAAAWSVSEHPGPAAELIWTPSDSAAYTRISTEVATGEFGEAQFLLGVPLSLQPAIWTVDPAGGQWGADANVINQLMLVPFAVVVLPACLLVIGRCTRVVQPAGGGRRATAVGASLMGALLTAYCAWQPAFIHQRTGIMAARRMMGVVIGPEALSILFACAVLLLVARATVTRSWNPVVVGAAIALAVMVREYNAVLAALGLAALVTIPGAARRTIETAVVAALAFTPQLVAWYVGWGSLLFPNRILGWEGSDTALMWRDLVVERYGLHFDGDPPTMALGYFRVNFDHWWPVAGPVLVVATALAFVMFLRHREHLRLWLVCTATMWITFLFNTCYINVTPQYRYNVVIVPVVAVIAAIAVADLWAVWAPSAAAVGTPTAVSDSPDLA